MYPMTKRPRSRDSVASERTESRITLPKFCPQFDINSPKLVPQSAMNLPKLEPHSPTDCPKPPIESPIAGTRPNPIELTRPTIMITTPTTRLASTPDHLAGSRRTLPHPLQYWALESFHVPQFEQYIILRVTVYSIIIMVIGPDSPYMISLHVYRISSLAS